MGKSRTSVYQVGRVYLINGDYYQVTKEYKGVVTLTGLTTTKNIKRKQRYR